MFFAPAFPLVYVFTSDESIDMHYGPSDNSQKILFLKWICFSGLLCGQFLAVLDVQIVSSSLSAIQAGVGASTDEISAVQTCYLVSETLAIPLVGYFTELLGVRLLFTIACSVFLVVSLVVGGSHDLSTLVFARTLQGFAGGIMLPLAFSYGFSAFPLKMRSRVSLILSLASVLAPTAGPVLGGFISDKLGWGWLFFINIPFGLCALILVKQGSMPDEVVQQPRRRLDWPSFISLCAFLMSAQFMLEEGQQEMWFESEFICSLAFISIFSLFVFVFRSFKVGNPIIDVRLFLKSDFLIGTVLVFIGGISLYGGSFLLPLFMTSVQNLSPLQAGQTMIVSGCTMLVTGLFLGPKLTAFNLNFSIAIGFLAASYGFWIGHTVTNDWGFWDFAALQAWRGFGIVIAMTATQTLTMQSIKYDQAGSATSILFLARNLGGASGVAVLSNILFGSSRQAQVDISASARYYLFSDRSPEALSDQARAVTRVAMALGFAHCFSVVALTCLMAALLSFVLLFLSNMRGRRTIS